MKWRKAKNILRVWRRIEECEPEISTEQLMERTAQECTALFGHEIDNGDVGEALSMEHERKEPA